MKWLFQPYPYRHRSLQKAVQYSLGEGLFLFLFLFLFEPFGIQQWDTPHKTLYLVGFGGLTTLGTFLYRIALPLVFPFFFQEKSWVIWKEIVGILSLVGLITALNLLYGMWFFRWHYSIVGIAYLYTSVLAIAFFPVVFWTLIDYSYQLKKYSPGIELPQVPAQTSERVTLTDEYDRNQWTLPISSIWALESSDNYCTLYYEESGEPKQVIIRSSLIRMEQKLTPYTIFQRCHRSFIVNLSRVKQVKGNAQGYFLHLHGTDLVVPVARKKASLVESLKKK